MMVHKDDVDRWETAVRKGTNQALMRRYFEEIQGLQSKCSAAEIALQSCKFSPQDEEGPRERLEQALSELREAVESFRKRFTEEQGDA